MFYPWPAAYGIRVTREDTAPQSADAALAPNERLRRTLR
jgi:hypothetical protein